MSLSAEEYNRRAAITSRGVAMNLLRGTKEEVWGTEVPHRGPGAVTRWGAGGEAPRSQRHMLNIRLNIAIDRHKWRTVQSPIIL